MDAPGVEALQERLGYSFGDPALLTQALTHRSYINENPDEDARHNERLEFLGDAVLDFVISDLLMARHPGLPEGDLSKLRASLVSEGALAEIARGLSLGEHLRMGRGEGLSGGPEKDSLLSDALEAVLAAIYLDSRERFGTAEVARVIGALFGTRLVSAVARPHVADFKTALQELVQKRFRATVRYTITQEEGPDHNKQFEAAVVFQGRELGRGAGRSKKQAEQAAARLALAAIEAEGGAQGPRAEEP